MLIFLYAYRYLQTSKIIVFWGFFMLTDLFLLSNEVRQQIFLQMFYDLWTSVVSSGFQNFDVDGFSCCVCMLVWRSVSTLAQYYMKYVHVWHASTQKLSNKLAWWDIYLADSIIVWFSCSAIPLSGLAVEKFLSLYRRSQNLSKRIPQHHFWAFCSNDLCFSL